MIIKSIKFKDFRPFKNEQKLDFTCNNDKNVVVILADNTCGKTTIILSFIWCFYGVSKFENPDEILNDSVRKSMPVGSKRTAEVEVIMEHDGIEYTAKRTNTYVKNPNGSIRLDGMSRFSMTYVGESGETLSCGQTTTEKMETINSIMPQDLSSYFFFEGEKTNSVTKKDISEAVKRLLGLDTYANMMTHLHGNTIKLSNDSVMGYFERQSQDDSNIKAHEAFVKKQRAEQDLEQVLSDIEEASSAYEEYFNKIENINEKLRDAAPTKQLQEQRDQIKKSLDREIQRLEKAYRDFFKNFSKNAINLLIYPMLPSAKDRLDQMDLSDKGITGIDINAINELLHRHECLCGTQLMEGSIAYKNVEAYKEILPPKSVGILVKDMLDKSVEKSSLGESYVTEFIEDYREIQLCITNINDLERQEVDCLARLKESGNIDSRQYEADLQSYRRRISDERRKLEVLASRKTTLESAIETHTNNYNMYKSANDKTKKYETLYAYAEAIYEWVNRTYTDKENKIKVDLQDRFENLFNSIYSGNRQAVIDDKYNLHVYSDNREIALSAGLHSVTYFSFVGALVQLAGEILRSNSEEDEMFGENYPLILDAAFSHTDSVHTKAIAKQLSQITEQLVFAVMEKDWIHAKEGIEDRTIRIYKINKISEDESEFKLLENHGG